MRDQAEYQRKYRQAHREENRAYQKVYHQTHKAEQSAKARAYRARNKEKIAEAGRQYYAENREKLVKKQRQYYQDHKEKVIKANSSWSARNRDKVNKAHRKWVASHPRSPEQARKYQLSRRARHNQVPRGEYLKLIRRDTRALPVRSKKRGRPPEAERDTTWYKIGEAVQKLVEKKMTPASQKPKQSTVEQARWEHSHKTGIPYNTVADYHKRFCRLQFKSV